MTVTRTPPVKIGYKVADSVLDRELAGRTLDTRDYTLVLNPQGGPVMVRMPDNNPLCCYLPGALKDVMGEVDAYGILHPLHSMMTNNRGMASGSKRIERGTGGGTRSDAMNTSSVMIGASDPMGVYRYCRLTEWTGKNLPEWQALAPMFRVIASHLEERVPDRYNAQMEYVRKTDPGWIVPGTPFTSITVNNSYPTGVHKDAGDLETGFSTLACIRRGEYEGGVLVFPQYRVAVDMQDGDLLLMDAHQWHGNTRMTCSCGERIQNRFCTYCGAERISIVSYYRTRIAECGSPEAEYERALENTEKRSQPRAHKEEPPEPEQAPIREDAAEPEPALALAAIPDPAPAPAPAPVKKTRAPRKTATATEEPVKTAPRRRRKTEAGAGAAVKITVNPETGEPLEV